MARRLDLPCLKCGEHAVYVDAESASSVKCLECEGEWEISELRMALKDWAEFLDWLDTHPARKPEVTPGGGYG